jgi:hypothetical protein
MGEERCSLSEFAESRIDEAFDALSHVHRRRVISALRELDTGGRGAVHVPDDVFDDQQDDEALRIELYHVHLPKLEAAGFIERYHDALVVRGPRFDVLEAVIEEYGDDDGGS